MPDKKKFDVFAWLRALVRSDHFDRVLLAGFVLVVLLGLGTSYADFRRLTGERKAGRSVADAETSIALEVFRLVDRDAFNEAAPEPIPETIELGDAVQTSDDAPDD